MAVVSYGRVPGYPQTTEKKNGKRIDITHSDKWQVITNDENDVGGTILTALPFFIGMYFADGLARLDSKSLKRDAANRLKWILDLNFTSAFDDESADDSSMPPDMRKPEWSWDFETMDILFTRDVDDEKPVANSVKEPFELTTEFVIPVLTITRHEASFDPDTIINYVNHRNENEFWGAPAGSALMAGIRDQKDSEEVFAGVAYRKVTYIIKFKLPEIEDVVEGWKEILMDRGTFYLNDFNKPTPFLDSSGNRKTGLLTDGLPLNDDEDPVFLKFNKHPEADFEALNLGPF